MPSLPPVMTPTLSVRSGQASREKLVVPSLVKGPPRFSARVFCGALCQRWHGGRREEKGGRTLMDCMTGILALVLRVVVRVRRGLRWNLEDVRGMAIDVVALLKLDGLAILPCRNVC